MVNRRKRVHVVVSVILSAVVVLFGPEARADDAPHNAPGTLRVITYNVQFLPDPVSWKNERPNPEYRANRIAEVLRGFDLAGLQEVFHAKHREQIVDRTRNNWHGELHQFASPHPKEFFTSGGCLILTRRPLLESSAVVFANYSKPADYGYRADGHAAKGVLHGRIARSAMESNNFIDVFVTHLEARADELRPLQYKEMTDFIRKKSDVNHPLLILGDLNTYGMAEYQKDPKSQYSQLMRELNTVRPESGVVDLWPTLKGDAIGGTTEQESSEIGKRVDYVLLGNPTGGKVQLKPTRIAVELFQDEIVGALSDHNAVVADLEWPAGEKDGAASR